jgi:hypothetical protein
MSCCGGKRAEAAFGTRPDAAPAGDGAPMVRMAEVRTVLFEYAGKTSLVAQGPVTGSRYYFAGQGKRLAVDSRDAPYLAGVPNLRRVREGPR